MIIQMLPQSLVYLLHFLEIFCLFQVAFQFDPAVKDLRTRPHLLGSQGQQLRISSARKSLPAVNYVYLYCLCFSVVFAYEAESISGDHPPSKNVHPPDNYRTYTDS